jgi:UDP:flavonoid glycosyltransferase YjiC (YdhE family)
MRRQRFLFVCHDAGGNIPPVIALAESLIRNGHDVAVLSQPSLRQRAVAAGCTFFAFSAIPDYDRNTMLEDQLDIAVSVIMGRSAGDDLISLTRQHNADLVIVDANLAGGLAAAETLTQPTVVLLHSMYRTIVDTWLGEIWPLVAGPINTTRDAYGLGAAAGWPDVFAGHDRLLSVVPSVFDAPVANVPSSMRHFGFLVSRTAASERHVGFPPGDEPAVLVGLSTTYHHHQQELLHTIVDALGRLPVRALVTTAGVVDPSALQHPPNVTITDHVPHVSVLDQTAVMVTHAGLGSVAAALSFGVPLVCTPISRDQPLNAQRVSQLGAGLALDRESSADEIRCAVQDVLTAPHYREAAASIAEASRLEGGPAAAAADLEAMSSTTR